MLTGGARPGIAVSACWTGVGRLAGAINGDAKIQTVKTVTLTMIVNTVTSDRVGRENKAHAVRAGP